MVASKLANLAQGERTDIQPNANLHKVPLSLQAAAEMVKVSRRSVANARRVRDGGGGVLRVSSNVRFC